ncbi:unhealthy ribosome biogenesis protein 2 homolog [Anneissia japonica]|uniref:unhealthy ribosome biogenesis protein 2 homolog n=1 Tax=Anneissia japonica TaxID=1529436 RepID=UPI0014254DF1|nr:unhealthy ribosome biogenesis protein 2 homolog [Anneissia japonica]
MKFRSSGVHRFIKDPATPWDQKLKLARFAWQSEKCFIPNKDQVLINWACTSITQASKLEIGQDCVHQLWLYLSDVLGSIHLQQLINTGALFSLQANFSIAVIEFLEDSIHHKDHLTLVLKCCRYILTYPTLAVNLTSNFEKLAQLTVTLIKISVTYVVETGELCEDLKYVLEVILKHYQSSLVKHTSARKLLVSTQENLLIPSFQLLGETSSDLLSIQDQLEVILSMSIFNRDLHAGYVDYLKSLAFKHVKPTELKLIILQIHHFFEFLRDVVNSYEGQSLQCIFGAFPKLFKLFLGSLKPSDDIAFTFLCKMCSILNICIDPIESVPTAEGTMETNQTETSKPNDLINWDLALPCVEQMLGIAFKHNIYHVASDAADGKPVFTWLNDLLQKLLNVDLELSSSWYRCLHHMVDLNHLLVEPHLKDIFAKSLLNVPSAEDPAKTNFFDHVLQVYTKLRQFDRFVEVLLVCVRETEISSFDWLDSFQNFPSCVHGLTPGLSLDVWRLFLNEISSNYIQKLKAVDEPPAKKRKVQNHAIPVKNLEAISSLSKMFILELPLINICSMALNLKIVKELMMDMKTDLLVPLLKSDQVNQDSSLTLSTFMLSYAWGEANLLLRQHTAYGVDEKLSLPEPLKHGDFSYLHEYVPPKVWRASSSKWVEAKDRRLDAVMILLSFQQVCSLLLYEDTDDTTVKSTIKQIMGSILSYSTDLKISPNVLWKGQIEQLDSESFVLYYLEMLTGRLPIMLPFLTDSQLISTASIFIQTVNTQDVTKNNRAADIVIQFLRSPVCLESRQFQTILMSVLLDETLSAIQQSLKQFPKKGQKLKPVFEIAYDKMWNQVAENMLRKEENDHEMWQNVQLVTKVICSYEHGGGKSFSWKQKEIDTVLNALQILRFVPLEHLMPGNHVRCLLVLCFLNHVMSQTSDSVLQGVPGCLLLVRTSLKTLCQVDLRGSFLELPTGCGLLKSLSSSLMSQKMLSGCQEDELQLRSVTHDIMSALLSAAYKSDNDTVVPEMSQWLLGELRKICKTAENQKNVIDQQNSVTSLLALLSVFVKQATSFARRKNNDQKEVLKELDVLADSALHFIEYLQSEDVLNDWYKNKFSCPVLKKDSVSGETSELSKELMSENLLFCNLLEMASVLLRYYADVINISEEAEFPMFQDKWSSQLLPLLQNILEAKIPTTTAIVKRIMEFFRSVCFVADASAVVSSHELEKMWLKFVECLKYEYVEEARLCGQMILKCLDSAKLSTLLADIETALTTQSCNEIKGLLMALKIIPLTNLQEESWQVLKQSTPQVLLSLMDFLHSLHPVTSENVDTVCSAVDAVVSLLIPGNDLLPAKVAMTTLHIVHFVPLMDLPAVHFSKCFTVLFHLLDTLLLQYPKSVTSSLPSFLEGVKYLLNSVMFRGREAIGGSQEKVQEKLLLKCAEDMDRLLTLLASHKEDVQKVIVVLVAEYVRQLQKGTLHPAVKKSLGNGLNSIVSICDDKSLSLLGATLPDGLKEIYKGFYSDYKKYFKYTGRV